MINKKSKKGLISALDQFTKAAEALMDGVVALNESNEIIWSNRRSQIMLNLNQFFIFIYTTSFSRNM